MQNVLLAVLVLSALVACGQDKRGGSAGASTPAAEAASAGVDLTGAGATFPYPIYGKWFAAYAQQTGVKINYQPIGSGGGIRQLTERTIDFGASDAPMTDAELSKAPRPVLHFPTVLGAVVITYNLPSVKQPLRLTGDVVAGIFSGEITKWNDSRITSLNPGVSLPAKDILVVHRSDGSGTTYIFSDFLSTVSHAWAQHPGRGKELQWPIGLGAKGNEGVSGQVKQTEGAIGYTELAYAVQNKLPAALIENAAGEFVAPSVQSATAAAAGAVAKLPANTDYRISIVNAPGKGAYPISSFTWLLVYSSYPDAVKGKKLVAFLHWYLEHGESTAPSLDYAPLPPNMITQLESRIGQIKVGATT
ncbi:MAG TPA: phosphate ABC transporter substrate-binding protein PstS [Gemmatimonadaceae bacterium]|nr:phosphate ABC transporter substrate-binding protein PstS [Gemmatimonadaceae bacterium]